jgi:hypothetical protein
MDVCWIVTSCHKILCYNYCTVVFINFFFVILQIGLSLLGIIIVVAVVNFWLLIPAAVMFSVFYILRVYFVATSRSIKRLEAISKFVYLLI